MDKEKRGYGTMVIVTFGALGAVLAALVGSKGQFVAGLIASMTGYTLQNWQVVYLIGGFIGLLLLLLRVGTFESGMFKNMKEKEVRKGDFIALFKNKDALLKYFYCILIGLPVWFMIGVPVSLSQDVFAKEFGIEGVVNGTAVMFAYLGLSAGDLASGILSQQLRSRKKVVYLYLVFSLMLMLYFLFFMNGISLEKYYLVCFLVGFASGYWAIFVSIAAEQFGTNIRSTVTNTVPNFVRGAVLPITMGFTALGNSFGNIYAALIVGIICLLLAAWATFKVKETFAKDLNYFETL
jgi:MFS family permease